MKLTSEDLFEYWLIEMDDALERFLNRFPPKLRKEMNFSPSSLEVLEYWILETFDKVDVVLKPCWKDTLDGLARYVGEVFRRTLGGHWEIRFDDQNYVYYGLPQLTGFAEKSTPICPHTLVTACVDRRTGKFLSGVLSNAQKIYQ